MPRAVALCVEPLLSARVQQALHHGGRRAHHTDGSPAHLWCYACGRAQGALSILRAYVACAVVAVLVLFGAL